MEEGVIKWFSTQKGYGFITNEKQEDLFFHQKSIIKQGFFGVQKSARVSFDVEQTSRGPQAVKIRVLD